MIEIQKMLRWTAAPRKKGQAWLEQGIDTTGRLRYAVSLSQDWPGMCALCAVVEPAELNLLGIYSTVDSAKAAAERLEQEAAEVEAVMENALVLLESALSDERTEMECSCDCEQESCSAWDAVKKWIAGKE
jgi:hypothetical protein